MNNDLEVKDTGTERGGKTLGDWEVEGVDWVKESRTMSKRGQGGHI